MPLSSRTPLRCPHFGRCGGCTLLDVDIDDQLRRKRERALERLGSFVEGIDPEISSPPRTPRHDRMSILYPARRVGRDLRLGIYRRGTHDIEEVVDCRVQHKALTELAVRAGEVMRGLQLPAYDEDAHRGLVRAFRARVMPGTGELLLGVVVTHRSFAERERLADGLWRAAQGLRDDQGKPLQPVGVAFNVNPERGNVLLGRETFAPRGRTYQQDSVDGLRFRVSFASFYQQSRHAQAVLFAPAMDLVGPVADLDVVDGYGGVGTFALRLLRGGARRVHLIESSPSACSDARHNLEANRFENGNVTEAPFGSAPLPPCDLLVADPPRAGLRAQGVSAILAAAPERLLLVSCSLASLARDLSGLTERYAVKALRLCDLFPHTEHIESLALLERR